jgi:3-hydroxypropionyl-CoA synthetase (ADP-forming)
VKKATYLPTMYESATQTSPSTIKSNTTLPSIHTAFSALQRVGIQVPPYTVLRTAQERPPQALPYPLYAKSANLALTHKKSKGAVFGVVRNDTECAGAFAKLEPFGEGMLLQTVADPGVELLIGLETDPQFGPYLVIGLGGSMSNLLQDRSYLFLNATTTALKAAYERTKAHQMVENSAPQQHQAVIETLARLQQLWKTTPYLQMVEINPLIVTPQRVIAVDVKWREGP